MAAVPLCHVTAFTGENHFLHHFLHHFLRHFCIIFCIIFYILFCSISFGSLRETDSPPAEIEKWTFAGYRVRPLTSAPFPTEIKTYNHQN